MKKKWFKNLVVTLVVLILATLSLLGFAELGMQYGLEADSLLLFFKRTWVIWLLIRWVMYVSSGYFLWRIYQFAKNDEDKQAFRKVMRLGIVFIAVIEVVSLMKWL